MQAMPSMRRPRGDTLADRTPAQLLASAGGGDDAAWSEIVRRYGRLVWSVLGDSGLDRATMADAHQVVWLRLCEHVDRIEDPARLGSWLATTARREAGRLRRERARVQSFDELIDAHDRGAVQPGDQLLDDELRAEVRTAVAQIDEASRRTLALLCAEERPGYRRIADLTGRPLGSIGPTRARALAKIRRLLDGN
jgi:RNA polymerase sigma factor (sigma-70 family)